jgi:DNA-binding transcriptional regulator YiaG
LTAGTENEHVSLHRRETLTRELCKVLAKKKTHLTGAEFRYLRSALLMSQRSLGQALGRTEQTIAAWEKNGHIPKYADTMMRFIYARHSDRDERVKDIVEAMNETDRDIYIVMRGSKKGWRGSESATRPANPSHEEEETILA